MSYFNKAILANGLNKYADKTCSWVLFGDNEYVAGDATKGFCSNGEEDGVTSYAVKAGLDGGDSLILSDFKDINIAAITPAENVRDAIGYKLRTDDTQKNLEVSSATIFTSNLILNVKSAATTASSTSDNSCFAFPGASTNNFNNSGFILKHIYLVIWNNVTKGSFPDQFRSIKGAYGQDVANSKVYWNGTTSGINKDSTTLFRDSAELVLFGTNLTPNDSASKFNDYNYTTFSVGELSITLQGLSS